MSNNTMVSLKDVSKSYGSNKVVKQINLEVKEGEFLTLLGPSGCGKTTTLRMIAGFEEVTDGIICIDGDPMNNVPAYKRQVNTAFQSYALFPHLSIYDNIAYGLKIKKVPKKEIKERVMQMLDLICLKGFEKRNPDQLSGGQKQRVSIARALINSPKVLLLDEPLGALDLKLRKQMQLELKRMQRQLGITFIYVTHDQEEALTMSDRIAVMNNGKIEQISDARELYLKPKTKFVAEFIGESNIFEGIVTDRKGEICNVGVECGNILCKGDEYDIDDVVYVCVRPENMQISKEPVEGFTLQAEVKEQIFAGNLTRIIAECSNGQEIKVSYMGSEVDVESGEVIYLWWRPEQAVFIQNESIKIQQNLMKGGV